VVRGRPAGGIRRATPQVYLSRLSCAERIECLRLIAILGSWRFEREGCDIDL